MLHVFDMDGTLLTGTTASIQVATHLGGLDDLVELERRFVAGELDTRGFAAAVRELWRELTPAVVTAAYAGSPWLDGIADVCADIRARGEHSAVITLSPDFFARLLLDLGFDDVVASVFPAPPFTAPVDPAGILTPADKVRVTRELAAKHGIGLEDCIAYGDSMSDAPLFRVLRRTVAVNADTHLDGLAAVAYRGTDLREAYALARALP